DERAFETPEQAALVGNAPPPRDWGSGFRLLAPWGDWQSNLGPVIGVGPAWTRFGFRRFPHATFVHLRALYAPLRGGFGVELVADRRWTGSLHRTVLRARASDFQVARFHGFGNETPAGGFDDERFLIEQRQLRADAAVVLRPSRSLQFSAGPSFKWTDPEDEWVVPGTPPQPGSEAFRQLGAAAALVWDRRDSEVAPRRGFRLALGAAGYGWDDGAPFGTAGSEARAYLSIPGSFGPTLALRAGGRAAVGDYPFQEAAYVGGGPTLRGYATDRFAGESAVYGGAELRARLGEVNLWLVRGRLGVLALGDAGRVYVDGESPGGWHTGHGGGLFLEALERVVTLTYVYGDKGRVYLALGMPF
ncbi:MAG TPA: BamA/TamA family outer membrane protein, partial [Longimicrobiaceae bacterium]|nr:BamA/TamA family outer membrane protein [Longimicrobiaceae bacterium]